MKLSKIWSVNKTFVIADTIEDAINTYKTYHDDNILYKVIDVSLASQEICIISNNITNEVHKS